MKTRIATAEEIERFDIAHPHDDGSPWAMLPTVTENDDGAIAYVGLTARDAMPPEDVI
jgi:hypothetical protein